ncbi:uncharacterized protein YybS (DUF2232 family) [Aneurinibacillus soli]|uniref:Uncharacterized protein n=1 Tax=Aneurinibacillus soli TaxID=1500254 RepID=A0A0U4NB87_9BACL|nr:DUF2232 domain-containing protein [Aneurinibacillus soli]PYE61274.1 uncharacterized protein YybS (DUF2232 family) [Aneurinibacillus soli]BAU26292.1 hypothetical protein CB4_00406 [Aneurinibacillus soli]
MQSNVRGLLEGAFMSAIFLVLFLISFYTPLGFIAIMALPVPMTVYGYRHPLKQGLLTVLAAVLLTFVSAAGVAGVLISLPAALVGIGMGYIYRKKNNAGQALITGTVIGLVTVFISIGISLLFLQINPIDTAVTAMKKMTETMFQGMEAKLNASLQQLPQAQREGAQGHQITAMQERIKMMEQELIPMVSMIIPASLIGSSLLTALLNHVLSSRVLQRMGANAPALPAIRHLRFPRSVLYYYLIALIIPVFIGPVKYPFVRMAVMNISILLQYAIIIQGFAVFAYWAHKKNWRRAGLIVAGCIFLIPPFTFILTLIGILDAGLDLRGRFLQ